MARQYSSNMWQIFVCPYCGQSLDKTNRGAACNNCQVEYDYAASGPIDFRLKKPKKYFLEIDLETPLFPESDFHFGPLRENNSPQVDFSGISVPYHLTKELISYFPKAKEKDSIMLDLGCNNEIHREVCEHAGYEYLGLDYNSPRASILGDAHSLPFKDNSIDFVLSVAVLEHIRFPFVMTREVHRVLKPGGVFIGTVAFLEPFHSDSFYHHTHLGICNSLQSGGFKIEHIAPSERWSVLTAQARMVLFPMMPDFLSKALVMPLYALHKSWWNVKKLISGNDKEIERVLHTTGAFAFIAAKPPS